MKDREKNKNHSKKRTVLIVLCVVLSIILAALLAITIYADHILGLIQYQNPETTMGTLSQSEIDDFLKENENTEVTFTGPTMDATDVNWADDPDYLFGQGQNIINILLVGQDRRKGESRARSDSMILCTINKAEKTITLTSFMRDLYVQIPGYQDNRINVSYFLGGTQLLDECIEKNFGVHIDGNVEIDFFGFQKAIDILGGVDVELTASEAAYLNRRGNWDLNNSSAGTWYLREGVNHLTGEQALAYSRIRNVGNGDFGRTDRQKTVLNALFGGVRNMNLTQMNELMNQILPLVSTDMPQNELVGLLFDVFPMIGDIESLQTRRVPADGAYQMTMIRGMSVLLPDLDKNREMLKEIMSE